VLERIAGCKFNNLTFVLPQQGTILGGNVNLHGTNLTLACFYGINFKANLWALFSMDKPSFDFSTESQHLVDDGRGQQLVEEGRVSRLGGKGSVILTVLEGSSQ